MKIKLSALIIFSCFILNFSTVNAFYYDQSSLREEILIASIHMFLDEGRYHLVIDNTGYLSGEYERDAAFVILEIFALNGDPDYVTDSRTLPFRYYWDIPINTETFFIFSIHFVFNITATKPVTIFLTDDTGFQDFKDEVANFNWTKPSKVPIIVGSIVGVIVIAGILAGIIERMRKKGIQQTYVEIEVEEQKEKPIKLGKTAETFLFCEQCNIEYTTNVKQCTKCGNKLKKVKRQLEEI